jgi:hypothetical protein
MSIRQLRIASDCGTSNGRSRPPVTCPETAPATIGARNVSGNSETERDIRPWPRQMRAETAARYVDEVSAASFLRSVGTLYPEARNIPTKGLRWLKEDLDDALDRLHGRRREEEAFALSELL